MTKLRTPMALLLGGFLVVTPAVAAATAAKPVERKVDPEVAKKKEEEAKAAAEKAAAEKAAAEKAAAEESSQREG